MSPSEGKNHSIGEQYARFVYKTCILRFFVIHIGSQHGFELVIATIVVVEDNTCQLVVGFFVPYFCIEKIHFIGASNFSLTVLSYRIHHKVFVRMCIFHRIDKRSVLRQEVYAIAIVIVYRATPSELVDMIAIETKNGIDIAVASC